MKAKFFKYYATNANDKYINAICFEGTEVDCFKCNGLLIRQSGSMLGWYNTIQSLMTLPEKGFFSDNNN